MGSENIKLQEESTLLIILNSESPFKLWHKTMTHFDSLSKSRRSDFKKLYISKSTMEIVKKQGTGERICNLHVIKIKISPNIQ